MRPISTSRLALSASPFRPQKRSRSSPLLTTRPPFRRQKLEDPHSRAVIGASCSPRSASPRAGVQTNVTSAEHSSAPERVPSATRLALEREAPPPQTAWRGSRPRPHPGNARVTRRDSPRSGSEWRALRSLAAQAPAELLARAVRGAQIEDDDLQALLLLPPRLRRPGWSLRRPRARPVRAPAERARALLDDRRRPGLACRVLERTRSTHFGTRTHTPRKPFCRESFSFLQGLPFTSRVPSSLRTSTSSRESSAKNSLRPEAREVGGEGLHRVRALQAKSLKGPPCRRSALPESSVVDR